MDEVLISCENVGKIFCRDFKASLFSGVKDIARDMFGSGRRRNLKDTSSVRLRRHEFWANKDINFELRRGECLGVIGKNGSGKTTLLKMLNGLIKPDTGRIRLRGEVGSLIALGAGFNPILTGRENIYNNAAVLGMDRKEIRRRFDEIVAFAEIESAIDAPVQTYSSGMKVRLGFAVATSINPDILILDEVLAVGDQRFRHKCYERMSRMHKEAAVIFVSHSMGFIRRLCDKVLYFDNGNAVLFGNVETGAACYDENNMSGLEVSPLEVFYKPVQNVELSLKEQVIEYGDILVLKIKLCLEEGIARASIGATIRYAGADIVAHINTARWGKEMCLDAGEMIIEVPIGPMYLNDGRYYLKVRLNDASKLSPLFEFVDSLSFELVSESLNKMSIPMIMPDNGFEIISQ